MFLYTCKVVKVYYEVDMAVAANQARLLSLTSGKSDLEYKMMLLSSQMIVLSSQSAQLQTERSTEMNQLIAQLTSQTSGDTSVDLDISDLKNQVGAKFDAQIAMLEKAQEQLDLQMGQYETQHQAVSEEQQNLEKTLDSNIKIDFKGVGSGSSGG